MKFVVQRANSIPPHAQLRDQIKWEIALGRLRPGDTLPSVRDLQNELGIGKNTIWRVYKQLEKAGLLVLRQGKGVRVNTNVPITESKGKLDRCERLCNRTLQKVVREEIHPMSFLRYLQQYMIKTMGEGPDLVFTECNKTETEVFSQQISGLWGADVKGILLDDLRTQLVHKSTRRETTKVLTNIYHLDEARNVLKGSGVEVIGLSFRWDRRMLKAIEDMKEPATVLFVFADPDKHRYGNLIVEEFRSLVRGRRITTALKRMSEIRDLRGLCRSRRYDLIFFSNRLWHRIPGEIKKFRFVARPTMQIDPTSLEQARERVGVIW